MTKSSHIAGIDQFNHIKELFPRKADETTLNEYRIHGIEDKHIEIIIDHARENLLECFSPKHCRGYKDKEDMIRGLRVITSRKISDDKIYESPSFLRSIYELSQGSEDILTSLFDFYFIRTTPEVFDNCKTLSQRIIRNELEKIVEVVEQDILLEKNTILNSSPPPRISPTMEYSNTSSSRLR